MSSEPTREEIDRLPGPVLLEFGASWCGHCIALEPHLAALRRAYPEVHFLWVEDSKGKPLGRSFCVRLWPNLVFLRDGRVVAQLARPSLDEVRKAFEELVGRKANAV
jgi:thioredoxin 1